jgi:beta-glucosidase
MALPRNEQKLPLRFVAGLIVLWLLYLVLSAYSIRSDEPGLQLPPNPLYRDSSVPIEDRIEDLLSYMTLEEKIGQMALVEKNSVRAIDDIQEYALGALLSGFGGRPGNNTTDGWAEMVSEFTVASKKTRLGIPIMYGADAIHGHSNVPGATVFPHFIGLGATRDADLVERVARATAEEMVATNIRWSFSPTLDIPRDIRWGRTYEAFSDDPELVALLGSAYVRGLQENVDSSSIFVLSTPKHYVGGGSMMWNTSSNSNFKIDQGMTDPHETALREQYLPPFRAAIETGTKSVMVGLNSWGNTKLAASEYLITTILKGELGFDGFVVSDWYGVYEIPGSDYRGAVTAINAGVDMVMLPFDYPSFIKNVTRAVRTGEIEMTRIDDAVRRILRAKFALDLFDQDITEDVPPALGSPAHRALAREAASKSLVLLKNENATLPVRGGIRHIRVGGSAASNIGMQTGAWTVEWQGIDGNWLPGATSILDGILARARGMETIEYNKDARFTSDQRADLGIAIVGEKPYAEGWGDTEYPTLSSEDLETIKRLRAMSDRLVVIIVSGRPLLITNEIGSWDAVVAAWFPGSEGAGVADVLFGDRPFAGVLPLPWPRHSEQLPITHDGHTADNTAPLFPRYFGLK